MTKAEMDQKFVLTKTNSPLFRTLHTEKQIFDAEWAKVTANPFVAYSPAFSGKGRLVANLAYLSKTLLIDICGFQSVRQYGGADQSDSAVIPHKAAIQDMVTKFAATETQKMDHICWDSAINALATGDTPAEPAMSGLAI